MTTPTDLQLKQDTSHEVTDRAWALRLVAKWCEDRAAQTADRRLLERCRNAYKQSPLVSPVERFAKALQSEIDENTDFWMELAKTMRDEAEEIEAANGKDQR
jgi:hypothetical protein